MGPAMSGNSGTLRKLYRSSVVLTVELRRRSILLQAFGVADPGLFFKRPRIGSPFALDLFQTSSRPAIAGGGRVTYQESRSMDARILRIALCLAITISMGASYRTPNFIVTASSGSLAREIGEAAEEYRAQLAKEWLGHELPRWQQPCPIHANVNPRLGAGGATSFMFNTGHHGSASHRGGFYRSAPAGRPFGWEMTLQGSRERVLDSVLPHEVTHTIFATHFGRPLPRWADEGACTTVEHESERQKQERFLYRFLTTGRGIAFNRMFAMTEYPVDILPLYSQGYSVARYLIAQGGRRKFVGYVGDGLDTNDWAEATRRHYGFKNLSELQLTWLDWVRHGSPPTERLRGNDIKWVSSQPSSDRAPRGPQPSDANNSGISQASATAKDGWYARRSIEARSARPSHRPALPGLRKETGDVSTASDAEVLGRRRELLSAARLVPVPAPATFRVSSRPKSPPGDREVVIEWGTPSPILTPALPSSGASQSAHRMSTLPTHEAMKTR